MQRVLMAEALGLELARRAAGILTRHREALTGTENDHGLFDNPQFHADNAIFTAVLDAANACLGRFDERPAEQRWCDALLQLLDLAEAPLPSSGEIPAA
jgi:hypothetical protein